MSLFKNIILNNNNEIPPLGFGTYNLKNPEESVYNALKFGYRLIDIFQRRRNWKRNK
jgi:diketogulonate reductase-like aldo/keto reductase